MTPSAEGKHPPGEQDPHTEFTQSGTDVDHAKVNWLRLLQGHWGYKGYFPLQRNKLSPFLDPWEPFGGTAHAK